MMKFDNNILVIGYGSVSQCTIPILLKHVNVNPQNITIIDIEDKSMSMGDIADRGVKFRQQKVTRQNLDSLLSSHLKKGDVLIDLAWNIGANDIKNLMVM